MTWRAHQDYPQAMQVDPKHIDRASNTCKVRCTGYQRAATYPPDVSAGPLASIHALGKLRCDWKVKEGCAWATSIPHSRFCGMGGWFPAQAVGALRMGSGFGLRSYPINMEPTFIQLVL